MAAEVFGNGLGIGAVLLHPEGKTLQTQVQNESTLGRLDAAKVPHQLGGALGNISTLQSKALGVGDAVVAFVRGAQAGELLGMGRPIKLAAVNNHAADGRCVTIHVLGGRVGHNIGAPLNGTAVDGSSEGVVHDQRDAMGMGSPGKFFNVLHGKSRVGNGFAKNRLGVGPESGIQLFFRAVRVQEGGLQTHLLHGHSEQIEAATVDGGTCHNVISAAGNIEYSHKVGSLAGAGQHSSAAAFQCANFGSHRIAGGVCQTGVEVAVGFQIEQLAHVLRSVIFKGCALHNGNLSGFPVARLITSLNAKCLSPQFFHGKSPHMIVEISDTL